MYRFYRGGALEQGSRVGGRAKGRGIAAEGGDLEPARLHKARYAKAGKRPDCERAMPAWAVCVTGLM